VFQRFLVPLLIALLAPPAFPSPLIVHEWGTFTSIAGADGRAVEWRPLDGPSDLPRFVHTLGSAASGLRGDPRNKGNLSGTVRMETPVIYFYTPRAIEVSVRVGFPAGTITEWYPMARSVASGIDWGSLRILPNVDAALPTEPAASHYYPARAVDAATVQACSPRGDERERFLFYRGVGSFQPPVTATLSQAGVTLDSPAVLGELIVFERRGNRSGYRVIQAGAGTNTFARPELTPDDGHSRLLRDLEALLVRRGLYEKEAHAMVETWRNGWFEDGLRILYVLPGKVTEAVLPLTIDPTPAARVRVLVGRLELLTPERLDAVAGELRAIGRASPAERTKRMAELRRREGRFAGPLFARLAGDDDPAIRETIHALLIRPLTGQRRGVE